MSKRKVAGPLGRTPALETLELAAAAVGLDVEGLTNLVVDAGALAIPPTDDTTEQLTLQDLGAHLRAQISSLPHAERPKWFKRMAKVQKGATVVALKMDGASTHSIATAFELETKDVDKLYDAYADKVGQNVTNARLTTIVGQMRIVAERAQEGSIEKKDWATYWRIQKDWLAAQQSLGVVDKAVHRIEVSHGLTDQAAENMNRHARLEAKRMRREEEVKKLDVTVEIDEVPEEFQTEDE